MNKNASSAQPNKMGIGMDEITEILLKRLLLDAQFDAVANAVEFAQSYTAILIALSKVLPVPPDQIGMSEALASMDKLIAVARKLKNL